MREGSCSPFWMMMWRLVLTASMNLWSGWKSIHGAGWCLVRSTRWLKGGEMNSMTVEAGLLGLDSCGHVLTMDQPTMASLTRLVESSPQNQLHVGFANTSLRNADGSIHTTIFWVRKQTSRGACGCAIGKCGMCQALSRGMLLDALISNRSRITIASTESTIGDAETTSVSSSQT